MNIKFLLSFILAILSFEAISFDAKKIIRQATAVSFKEFLRTESFTHVSGEKIQAIIYGNKKYGYYSSEKFKENGQISFSFIPPGYQTPIEFYTKSMLNNKLILKKLGVKKYQPVFINFLEDLNLKVKGKFSSNFFNMNAAVHGTSFSSGCSNKAKYYTYFHLIFNNFGEIVWLKQEEPSSHSDYNGIFLPNTDKYIYYGNNNKLKKSFFDIVDIRTGEEKQLSFPFKKLKPHHDLLYDEDLKKLLVPHEEKYLLSTLIFKEAYTSMIRFIESLFKNLKIERHSIKTVDLESGEIGILWESLTEEMVAAKKYFLGKRSWKDEENGSSFFISFLKYLTEPPKTLDVLHINSIDKSKHGEYLFSFRNQNALYLIDDKKQGHWLHGEKLFRWQHHASFGKGANLFLFDNQKYYTNSGKHARLLELSRKNNKLEEIWSYQSNLVADYRGSTYSLENGNVLGYFPGLRDFGWRYFGNHLLEVDYQSKKAVGELFLPFCHTYRVTPLQSIGSDHYWGDKLAR